MKEKKGIIVILILITAILALVWQGYIYRDSAGSTEAVATKLRQPDQRPPAPEFTLLDLEGNEVRLKDYRGSVVFLGFWTTW